MTYMIKRSIQRWKRYSAISNVGEVTRRYFVMNAFDGALTMLGVVIGAYISGIAHPTPILSAGVAGSLAMGISGISGAYMAEKAERTKKLKHLEKAMLKDMKDGLHYRSQRFAAFFAALVDGISPAVAAVCVISPFFVLNLGLISADVAFFSSITITLIVLFLLGVYLARISDESMIRYGIQMLAIGLLTAFLAFVVSLLLGGSFTG